MFVRIPKKIAKLINLKECVVQNIIWNKTMDYFLCINGQLI